MKVFIYSLPIFEHLLRVIASNIIGFEEGKFPVTINFWIRFFNVELIPYVKD